MATKKTVAKKDKSQARKNVSDRRLSFEARIQIEAARAASMLSNELNLNNAENLARVIKNSALKADIMRDIELARRELGLAFH